MKTGLAFVSGIAVGYLLGFRTGRNSYEKLKGKVRGFRPGPTPQDKVPDTGQPPGNTAAQTREQASPAAAAEMIGAPRSDTAWHKDGAAAGTPGHARASTPPESGFYGIGGPASHGSLDADPAQPAHDEQTGSQNHTD